MANTTRGWISFQGKAGSVYAAADLASMVQIGSAVGYANVAGASAAFPLACQMNQSTATIYAFDSAIIRLAVLLGGTNGWW